MICDYHPSREAVDKCQRCNRLICLQDRMVVRNRHHHSSSMFNNYYTETILCPLCNYDMNKEGETMISKFTGMQRGVVIVIVIFFMVPLLFMLNLFLSFQRRVNTFPVEPQEPFSAFSIIPFFVFAFMFLVIILIVFLVFKGTSSVSSLTKLGTNRAAQTKEEFLRTVENEEFLGTYKRSDLACFQCGSPISETDRFCPSCGDPTREELSSKST